MSKADESRADRRERFEKILTFIEHNTGGGDHPQAPGVRWSSIMVNRCNYADEDPDDVKDALEAAQENGYVVKYHDRENRWRYVRATEEGLQNVIGSENMRDEPRLDLIEWAVDQLEEVRK